MTGAPESLDDAASQLYGLPPKDFTAARDELSKAARAAGDRELATSIKALKRPTTAAWLLNVAVQRELAELTELLDVGAQLRRAQADLDGPRMKDLSAQRQALEASLLERVREIAAENDQDVAGQVSVEVDQTLRATAADPRAAQAVASGRLTRALSYAGFGDVDVAEATATPLGQVETEPAASTRPERPRPATSKPAASKSAAPKPAAAKKNTPDELAERREAKRTEQRQQEERRAAEDAAEREAEQLRTLESAGDEARAAAEHAQRRRDAATRAAEEAQALVDDLHRQLQDARAGLASASKEAASAEREHDRARRGLAAAERKLSRARGEPAKG